MLEGLRGGDDWAWTELYRQHRDAVFSFVYDKLARTVEDAEDITQDAIIRAFKDISEYKGDSELRTWLCTLAKNASIDFYRSPATQYGGLEFHDTMLPDEQLSQQSDADLRESIANLPERERHTITAHLEGYSCKEIAKDLGTTESTVHNIRDRAKAKIWGDHCG